MSAGETTLQARRPFDDRRYDHLLLGVVVALLSLGVVMVYSASVASDRETLQINLRDVIRHGAHIALGMLFMALGALVKLEWLQAAGASVPAPTDPAAFEVEISPLYAADAEELKRRVPRSWDPSFPLVLEE